MHKSIPYGFTAITVILLLGALVANRSIATLTQSAALVTHTHQVKHELHSILSSLTEIETGQRGYLLTGDPAHLEPYHRGRQQMDSHIVIATELTSGNPALQHRLEELRPLLDARLAALATGVSTWQQEGPEAARRMIQDGQGQDQMNEVRRLIGGMVEEEDRLLELRSQQARTSAAQLAFVFGTATAFSITAVVGVFWLYRRDVTERRRAFAVQSRLASIVDSAEDAIISKDLSGTITTWNAGAEKLYGFKAEEAIGQPITMIIPYNRMVEEVQLVHRLKRGETVEHLETERRHKDGHWVPVSLTISPIRDESGAIIGASKIARNISERKRADAALRRAQEELEQRVAERTTELQAANQELEAFSYTVSHDLRAPLRAIDGFSRILLDEFAATLPPECQEYLRDIRANTQQMGHLLDDLLAFSRLSRQPLKCQPIAAKELVAQALDELQKEAVGREVNVSIGDLPPCSGDPALLKQVWTNLLSNAFKYTTKRPIAQIAVGALNSENGEQTYFVKDNGVGFDMRYANKLFGVFQRLHRSEDYDGTGVGLAIVQRIIHRHGGRVWADARPNEGATFFFTVPANEDSHA